MLLPRWQETGGQDFVFFHSHPGFLWDDLPTTIAVYEMLCQDFQWATLLVIEQVWVMTVCPAACCLLDLPTLIHCSCREKCFCFIPACLNPASPNISVS